MICLSFWRCSRYIQVINPLLGHHLYLDTILFNIYIYIYTFTKKTQLTEWYRFNNYRWFWSTRIWYCLINIPWWNTRIIWWIPWADWVDEKVHAAAAQMDILWLPCEQENIMYLSQRHKTKIEPDSNSELERTAASFSPSLYLWNCSFFTVSLLCLCRLISFSLSPPHLRFTAPYRKVDTVSFRDNVILASRSPSSCSSFVR